MRTSETITEIAAALLTAQKAIGAAKKGADNPFFHSKYADLGEVIEAVKEPLNAAGITFLQGVGYGDGSPYVETRLLHESGEWLSTDTPVVCAKEHDPQAFGSAVTYAKRYSLQALLGVPSEDDDGEGAMDRRQASKPTAGPAKPTFTVEMAKADKMTTWLSSLAAKGRTAADAKKAIRVKHDLSPEAEIFINEFYDADKMP